MIHIEIKSQKMEDHVTYYANCYFNNDHDNKFTYYAVPHETKDGFISRIVKTVEHEFKIKPEYNEQD